MSTRLGTIEIANSVPFSHHCNGFGLSPYFQEQLVFLGQLTVYQQAAEVAQKLLQVPVSSSQIYRLTTHYGQAIEGDLEQPSSAPVESAEVVYAQVDGSMVLTDKGWKEVKVGRVFTATAIEPSPVADRGGVIADSQYVAHLGSANEFWPKFTPALSAYQAHQLVFVNDGAVWIRRCVAQAYPQARCILDFYHALSHLGQVAQAAIVQPVARHRWLDQQAGLLKESKVDEVLANIRALPATWHLREQVCGYVEANRDRMDYQRYQQQGLVIGSGAIEAAHRSLVQTRLKRSGQRWSEPGAQRVLNLRVCWMNQRWELVRQHIEPHTPKLAA